MKVRGQISVEYLIVVGFVLFIVSGLLGVAFFYVNSVKDQIKVNQARNYAGNLISAAESVFFAGEPSRTTVQIYLPSGVQSVIIINSELVITIETSSGTNVMAFPSNVPLDETSSFSVSEGIRSIQVVAGEGDVSFLEAS